MLSRCFYFGEWKVIKSYQELTAYEQEQLHAANVAVDLMKDEKKSFSAMSIFYQTYTKYKMGLITLEEAKCICADLDFGGSDGEKK